MNEDFCVVPSFAVIPCMAAGRSLFSGGVQGLEIDPTKVYFISFIPDEIIGLS